MKCIESYCIPKITHLAFLIYNLDFILKVANPKKVTNRVIFITKVMYLAIFSYFFFNTAFYTALLHNGERSVGLIRWRH